MRPASHVKQKSHPLQWLHELDRILRGEATRPLDIQQADIRIPVLAITAIIIVLGMVYGFCMGVFALARGFENSQYQSAVLQTCASVCKVPLLFGLTLIVTFPSLYVFNALVGSQLKILSVLKLLIASLAVNLAVLASLGPILAFFSVSTPNYSFIVLLNVFVFALAGTLGLVFLVQTLNRLTYAQRGDLRATRAERTLQSPANPNLREPANVAALTNADIAHSELPGSEPQLTSSIRDEKAGPLDHLDGLIFGRHVRMVFTCWIVVYAFVGIQAGYVLRPFIGDPSQPTTFLRRESFQNAYVKIVELLGNVLVR